MIPRLWVTCPHPDRWASGEGPQCRACGWIRRVVEGPARVDSPGPSSRFTTPEELHALGAWLVRAREMGGRG